MLLVLVIIDMYTSGLPVQIWNWEVRENIQIDTSSCQWNEVCIVLLFYLTILYIWSYAVEQQVKDVDAYSQSTKKTHKDLCGQLIDQTRRLPNIPEC